MDLSTTYLGMRLEHPIMPGASPMVDDLDLVRRLEDAGASAIVMHSLFEEQIHLEQLALRDHVLVHLDSHAEARTYFPGFPQFALGPDEYLEQIVRIRERVSVPVIASLNGVTSGGWLEYAKLMEEAGASALELNLYFVATELDHRGVAVENHVIEVASAVKGSVGIPVALKLSPFYSSIPNLAARLEEVGVDGLVLFNRFYQPDIDVERLEVTPTLKLSDPSELLLRLRWLAVLSGRVKASLAVSGGVHSGIDAVKAVMAGAHAVQLVSALLKRGPEYLKGVREELAEWLERHEYASLEQAQGSMGLKRCPDPGAYERANYLKILQSWRGLGG